MSFIFNCPSAIFNQGLSIIQRGLVGVFDSLNEFAIWSLDDRMRSEHCTPAAHDQWSDGQSAFSAFQSPRILPDEMYSDGSSPAALKTACPNSSAVNIFTFAVSASSSYTGSPMNR